ncbi:hypothetical protein B1R32_11466 [Abditibacterium utsteinense]|uniref:J domain-containing protein n=1 Tax=Abditibacterium utsteinense TaxID=1960156 RepID=A0A2S8SR21_9BACT|nr:hypothetical protein [Abditibacterium utsteinense]PQV63240.1 hypothetical protein B1R32_11466 [Abditibacterium utsteinense]
MAEEFVDLYEVLELPVDADRNTLRRRVNELYLDAQRNLDHRNFATRVKFQELFEITLPQARYILLDDGRRDDYDRLVYAFRATKNEGPPAPAAPHLKSAPATTSPSSPSEFALERPTPAAAEQRAPAIEPLPQTEIDPAQLAQEREELWKKWKSGLEVALHTEGDKPKSRAATTSAPTSFSTVTPATAAPATVTPAPAAPAAVAEPVEIPKVAARPKVNVSFDFSENQESGSDAQAGDSSFQSAGESKLAAAEIEQRRTEHRRHLMKEVLVNVGLVWGIIGAAMVVVPGLIGLIAASGHYYPRGAQPLVALPSRAMWGGGVLVILVAAFFASRALSKSMRRKKATELALLPYEVLLKQIGKS